MADTPSTSGTTHHMSNDTAPNFVSSSNVATKPPYQAWKSQPNALQQSIRVGTAVPPPAATLASSAPLLAAQASSSPAHSANARHQHSMLTTSALVGGSPLTLQNSNIRALIQSKEKELHDINEYRIHTLEELIGDKERELNHAKERFSKLKEDFQYNLKLLEDRDVELEKYDSTFVELREVLKERDAQIADLKVEAAEMRSELQRQKDKFGDQERMLQDKLVEEQERLESLRWEKEDQLRKQRDEYEAAKRELQHNLAERDDQVESLRRETQVQLDEAIRSREREWRSTEESLELKCKQLETRAINLERQLEEKGESLKTLETDNDTLREHLRTTEKQLKHAKWELEDTNRSHGMKVNELEEEKRELQAMKGTLLEEYEGKMSELLQNLHNVERAFMQQKQDYETRLQQLQQKREEEVRATADELGSKVSAALSEAERLRETLDNELKDRKRIVWELEDQIKERDRATIEAEKELDKQREDLLAKEQQYTSAATQWEKDIKDRDQRIKNLESTLREQRERMKQYRDELQAVVDRELATERRIKELELEAEKRLDEVRSSYREQMEINEAERNALQRVAEERLEKVHKLETECGRVRADLNLAREALAATLDPDAADNPSLREAQRLAPEAARTTEGSRALEVIARSRNVRSEREISLEKENTQLRDQCDALQGQTASLRGVVKEMRAEMEQLADRGKGSAQNAQTQKLLRDTKQQRDEERKEYQRQIRSLEEKVSSLQDKLSASPPQDSRGDAPLKGDEDGAARETSQDEKLSSFIQEFQSAHEKRLQDIQATFQRQLEEQRRQFAERESDAASTRSRADPRSAAFSPGDEAARSRDEERQRKQHEIAARKEQEQHEQALLAELERERARSRALEKRIAQHTTNGAEHIPSTTESLEESATGLYKKPSPSEDIGRLLAERERLIEVANAMRSDLSRLVTEKVGQQGTGDELPSNAKLHSLEETLATLSKENSLLRRHGRLAQQNGHHASPVRPENSTKQAKKHSSLPYGGPTATESTALSRSDTETRVSSSRNAESGARHQRDLRGDGAPGRHDQDVARQLSARERLAAAKERLAIAVAGERQTFEERKPPPKQSERQTRSQVQRRVERAKRLSDGDRKRPTVRNYNVRDDGE